MTSSEATQARTQNHDNVVRIYPPQPEEASPPPPSKLPSGMETATTFVALVSSGVLIWTWVSPERLEQKLVPVLGIPPGTSDLGTAARLDGLLLTLIPLALLLYALWQSFAFFRDSRLGMAFTERNARRIQKLAMALALLALLRPLLRSAYAWLLSADGLLSAPSIGAGDILTFFFSAVFFYIGRALEQAAKMRSELDEIL